MIAAIESPIALAMVSRYWMAALIVLCGVVVSEAEMRLGRATFYGNEPWLWNIHQGSCGYGYIFPDEPLGWDVAALADVHYEYQGSCGSGVCFAGDLRCGCLENVMKCFVSR